MDDLISRQAAIDAISEFLFYTSNFDGMRQGFDLSDWKWKIEGVLSDLPSSQPTQTNTPNTLDALDCVSRQAAIDAFLTELTKRERKNLLHTWSTVEVKYFVVDMLEKLPSAQPERKMGKWIYNSPVTMKCDQCGFVIKDWDWHRFKFCPNCDCDMRGEQE